MRVGCVALLLLSVIGAREGRAEAGAGGQAPAVETVRSTLARWVETQKILSRERSDWQVGKELLEQRIALIQGEIGALEERTRQVREGAGETDRRQSEVVARNASLRDAAAALHEMIGGLEAKTRRLLVALPDVLKERVAPLSQRLPAAQGQASQTSLSERFQNAVGVLNEINKFNRDVTVTSEIRRLPDGTSAEVRALYLGLGQGYYVSPRGDLAGVGLPAPEGWQWSPANELAPEISEAIAILENRAVPAFVPLPVSIQ
jgi:FtsZ-binding cell division protein ZapB